MQAQSHIPCPGLTPQNGSNLSSHIGGSWRAWKGVSDLPNMRNCMFDKIIELLKRHKNSPGLEKQLYYVARHLEEGLFKEATTKEEYMDIRTLETRLQAFAKRSQHGNCNQRFVPHSVSSNGTVGTMIPTPGMSNTGFGHSVMATSSGNISMMPVPSSKTLISNPSGMGCMLPAGSGFDHVHSNKMNVLANSGDNLASVPGPLGNMPQCQQVVGGMSMGAAKQIMSTIGFRSRMIPTSRLGKSPSGGMGYSSVNYIRTYPQKISGGANGHFYQNMSGQMGGNSMQQKNSSYDLVNGSMNCGIYMAENNQNLMNGTTELSNSGGYSNALQYGNVQLHASSDQNTTQQHRQGLMQSAMTNLVVPVSGDGYAMNAADLEGSGNLYAPVSSSVLSVASSLNGKSLGLQSTQMIPVPGLPSQQQILPSLQQCQQNQSQKMSSPHGLSFLPKGQSIQSKQQKLRYQQHQSHHQQQLHTYQQTHMHQQIQRGQQQQQLPVERRGALHNQPEFMVSGQKQAGTKTHQNGALKNELEEIKTLSLPTSQQQQRTVNFKNSQHLSQVQSQKLHKRQVSSSQDQQEESNNVYNDVAAQVMPEVLLQGEQELQAQEKHHLPQQFSSIILQQQPSQEKSRQIMDQDMVQEQKPSQEVSGIAITSTTTSQPRPGTAGSASGNMQPSVSSERQKMKYYKQQMWLLYLHHVSRCRVPECQTPNCIVGQELWAHVTTCRDTQCSYPCCRGSRKLLIHCQQCKNKSCPICGPLRHSIMKQRAHGCAQSSNLGAIDCVPASSVVSIRDSTQEEQRPSKRRKFEPSSPCYAHQEAESAMVSVTSPSAVQAIIQVDTQDFHPSGHDAGMMKSHVLKSSKVEPISVKIEQAASPQQGSSQKSWESKNDICQNPHAEHGHIQGQQVKAEPAMPSSGNVPVQVKLEAVQVKQETRIDIPPIDNSASEKFDKSKIKGVSLTELFTLEQIREHVEGLRQWGWQSKAKVEKYQNMELRMTGETCQLCNLDTITFDPSPIYCSPCGVRIKHNAFYYLLEAGDTRHCFCIACHSESRGDSVKIDGNTYAKLKLEKKKNMDEIEESWVCCDICEKWQHQVCTLFNGKRNENEQADYTCPNCYMEQIKRGVRKPLPQSAVLGAKDLPRTCLSDHIEQRLFRRLKEERQERAKALGKNFEEVPGAEALVVRVVSSVDKVLEVKQQFFNMFQHQNYSSEFPYKSKVLMLFQKIEGVEVCLFGMYVQEFGSDCSHPNQRHIYLSYLDSVKYFRPDVKTMNGEALRTFVYHEILIGYLDYCKRWGLTSCYIWACPPLRGDDYILYYHPETQKTPKSDKLREWYLMMLRKASKEDIVVDVTNMYDYFFVSTGEQKAIITAARLPYFDGDYWPGAAEEMIMQIQREEADGHKYQKNKKNMTKRSLKAAAQTDFASNTSKDALLMKKLGDSIHPMKEDFIMVHLQHACTHCCLFIVSSKRWVCKQCKKFQLCEKCYKAEQKLDGRERHPVNNREKHLFFPIEVSNVPADTKDKDEIMESEFFDTRQAFLRLCKGNHYQYDTLRRAKHSSMMVLYHLHNPTEPAFVSTCNICQHDIETGQGWCCEICPDYDLCNACYQKHDSVKHPHRLTAHPFLADQDAQNQEARQHWVLQQRKMLDLLIHASQCISSPCAYQNCRKVNGLFRHGTNCKIRAAQGCSLCKRMWYILQLHAQACKESECRVPRCKDLKQHIRRSQNQMESRRRADVMEMMRNRAAEIA
ncbi:hypothetical protein SUGI_0463290 [Cryptomeria japonica]|uniref:histone acetyltransferase HAC1 n=1 Tax=Cryptomeria japonica TaxID=3369 RepID=UPI002408A4DF|nr:histone acetyltransferase HAC1 [Cryptomeria japonica]XP_057858552.2 histone acetyltransferase HAC1 [Cryptomeria japonica]GLJ24283.1 hypothetical protein SUGI_0463290 [Cryptomeria japonica]